MIISEKEFKETLEKYIKTGDEFYFSLLKNIIDNPNRYCGIYRLSNFKSKIIQNITQSKEIKFGDFVEELMTKYIEKIGYTNLSKNLIKDEDENKSKESLELDQYFTDGKEIYITEMKIRDDHDSTKKRGQYENFQEKIKLIIKKHPDKKIKASMWFIDSSLKKNKKYYLEKMSKECFPNCELNLFYGGEFFKSLGREDVWDEFNALLEKYIIEHEYDDIEVPDFGNSLQMLKLLKSLDKKHLKKLTSQSPVYERLRNQLFSNGENLKKLEEYMEEMHISNDEYEKGKGK